FAAAGVIRKSANFHSTAKKTPKNSAPQTSDCGQMFHFSMRGRIKSNTNAGAMTSTGKVGGMNCVTGLNTGPSFGSAGKSGRTQISNMRPSMNIAATMVAAQRREEAHELAISTDGTVMATEMKNAPVCCWTRWLSSIVTICV